MSGGRGGKKPKLIMRTEGGWVGDLPAEIDLERAAVERKVGRTLPDEVWAKAEEIMRRHARRNAIFDNPFASYDKNNDGVGKFAVTLQKHAAKMAQRLDDALKDERSHDLHGIVSEQLIAPEVLAERPNPMAGKTPSLRSHMIAAQESLFAIEVLLERLNIEGEMPPLSQAEIRVLTGSELKSLAKDNKLRQKKFVDAFNIHVPDEDSDKVEAFDQWFQRLN